MTPPKMRTIVQQLSVEEIAKLKINIGVSAIAIALAAVLSAAGTGGLMVWNASSKWTEFQTQQVKRDKEIAAMVAIVTKHDQTIPKMEQRQNDLERFCCPAIVTAINKLHSQVSISSL